VPITIPHTYVHTYIDSMTPVVVVLYVRWVVWLGPAFIPLGVDTEKNTMASRNNVKGKICLGYYVSPRLLIFFRHTQIRFYRKFFKTF